jgi:hypothetical protein
MLIHPGFTRGKTHETQKARREIIAFLVHFFVVFVRNRQAARRGWKSEKFATAQLHCGPVFRSGILVSV